MSKGIKPDAARMAEVITLLKRRVRAFGKRPLTEQDFQSICKRRDVFVINDDSEHMILRGLYTVIDEIPCIILRASNQGTEKQWTMFHELGHYFLHSPETGLASDEIVNKAQYEANAFAAICLFPSMDEYTVQALEFRIDLYKQFGL